ncbi:MAG: hypothetical protein E7372_03660 [Clostridiales bacterium]|nr:hypothetical protein [Clostridiales bacterium]
MQKNCFVQNEYNNLKNKEGNKFFICYLVLTIIVYVLPAMKLRVPYILAALLMCSSLLYLVYKESSIVKYIVLLLFLSSFFFFRYAFFSSYSLIDAINETIRNIRFFIPVLWGVYALKNFDIKSLRMILVIFLVIVGYILINTLIELEKNPEIARLLAQGTASSTGAKLNSYRLSNIGGFEFSYMMGIIALCLMWLFTVQKKPLIKIGVLILYCISFYYILQSQYTTLLLLTFLGSAILLFVQTKSIFIRVLIALLSLLLIIYIVDIFYYLSDVFSGSVLQSKFIKIANSITQKDTGELGSRPELLRDALFVWAENPIFGSFDKNLNAHSLIMATLANTGVVGLCILIYLAVKSFKLQKNLLNDYKIGLPLYYCVTGFIVLLSFFNPIGYVFEITIAGYFIVPIFIVAFSKKRS